MYTITDALNNGATIIKNCPVGRIVNVLSNSISSTSACNMIINPPDNKCDNEYDEITKNINYLLSELKRRHHDLKIDKSGLSIRRSKWTTFLCRT